MRRLKVIYLPLETVARHWQDDVVAAIGDRHDLSIYDDDRPIPEQFESVDAVLDTGGSVGTREMYDAAQQARLWQILGTGLDHVDVEYMKTKVYAVSNCPGQFSAVGLAECALMFMLMLSRRVHEAAANFRSSIMYRPSGCELEDRVLGIVGFGSSGQALARRANAFDMRVRAIDVRQIEPTILEELQPEFVGTPNDLDSVVAASDFLSLHLHLTKATRHIIDARRLALMKPTACIINVARGDLVDEEAMHEALLAGKLGGTGLDVFSQEPVDPTLPVYQLPNVVTLPHVSGATDGTSRRRAAAAAENVDRVARGLEPLYRVDV